LDLARPRRAFLGNRRRPASVFSARWDMPRSTSKAITSTAILSSLPERLSARLFAGAKSCHLNAGDALFAAGDSGDGCYRLEQGLLKVIITSPRGEERLLAILRPRQ